MTEEQNKQNLNQARKSSSPLKTGISGAKNAFSIAKQVQITDFIFILPFMLAILKDVADTLLVGSLPGIGTVISICCSIFGGLYIWLIGAGDAKSKAKGFFSGTMKRLLVLLGGTTIEAFGFGVNFLPIETLTFAIMYFMVLLERAENSNQVNENEEQYA